MFLVAMMPVLIYVASNDTNWPFLVRQQEKQHAAQVEDIWINDSTLADAGTQQTKAQTNAISTLRRYLATR